MNRATMRELAVRKAAKRAVRPPRQPVRHPAATCPPCADRRRVYTKYTPTERTPR